MAERDAVACAEDAKRFREQIGLPRRIGHASSAAARMAVTGAVHSDEAETPG
jgi:hypothetical protein